MKAIYKAIGRSLAKATLQQEVIPPIHTYVSYYLIRWRFTGSVNYIYILLSPGAGITTIKYLLEIRKEYTLDYCMEQIQTFLDEMGRGNNVYSYDRRYRGI